MLPDKLFKNGTVCYLLVRKVSKLPEVFIKGECCLVHFVNESNDSMLAFCPRIVTKRFMTDISLWIVEAVIR